MTDSQSGRETPRLPLSALLSQALIAYTFEFDRALNSAHDSHGGRDVAPSLAMWSNVLRFVGDRGVEARRLPELSGISKPATQILLHCLERHGWVTIDADAVDGRKHIVRLTARCRKLRRVWLQVTADVEKRWEERVGEKTIADLREALEAATSQLGSEFAHYPVSLPNRGGTPTGL
jgi:DNA-binding MarR family transcriptional regulator